MNRTIKLEGLIQRIVPSVILFMLAQLVIMASYMEPALANASIIVPSSFMVLLLLAYTNKF